MVTAPGAASPAAWTLIETVIEPVVMPLVAGTGTVPDPLVHVSPVTVVESAVNVEMQTPVGAARLASSSMFCAFGAAFVTVKLKVASPFGKMLATVWLAGVIEMFSSTFVVPVKVVTRNVA